jgi:hypothetical protein
MDVDVFNIMIMTTAFPHPIESDLIQPNLTYSDLM